MFQPGVKREQAMAAVFSRLKDGACESKAGWING